MQLHGKKLKVCSFFSGGGLLDYGFKDDFEIIWANELNKHAATCYRENIGNHIVVGDIEDIAKNMGEIPEADLFIGGPPCIEFSSNGTNKGEFGKSGKLVWTYQKIVQTKKPLAFIMENVMGLARKHKFTLERLVQSYENIGYDVKAENISSDVFGTPQTRERIFLVGIRKDLEVSFQFPKFPQEKKKTVFDAIGDLPQPISVKSRCLEIGEIANHVTTWTSPTPERIFDILANPRPNQWVGIRRLEWDKPSHTLTAHIAKDGREFLHPKEQRRLTVRESLRIMGVPDSFIVSNNVPLSEQYKLVGNGVAYQVAKALSASLLQQLTQQKGTKNTIRKQEKKSVQMSIFDYLDDVS